MVATSTRAQLQRDEGRFGRNAEPFILLVLAEGRSYGYEICARLEALGFRRAAKEPASVYRLLRGFEEAGLIESEWDVAGAGPARRYYQLTESGRAELAHQAKHLARDAQRIQRFFEAYAALGEVESRESGVKSQETHPSSTLDSRPR